VSVSGTLPFRGGLLRNILPATIEA
jgi:hypothetical protein